MRYMSAVVAAALVPCFAIEANAQATDLGTPPSGSIPIFFNDRHVYAKPARLRNGRLLAALVRGNVLLVPLRSMFEQAGASVIYDRETRSTVVRKNRTIVEVTVGVPEVRINGEVRPLDVAPTVEGDDMLVPVRVIAEALDAYVEYNAESRSVVVRFIPQSAPTPEPVRLRINPPSPELRATVPPGPPIPVGTPMPETYLIGDTTIAPRVANALSPHDSGATGSSFDVRVASEFSLLDTPLLADVEYSKYVYPHPNGFVTLAGGRLASFESGFEARDTEVNLHLGAQIAPAKLYVAAGYASLGTNNGYPRIGGFGVGIEKLPVLTKSFSYYASVFYYPNASGACSVGTCSSAVGDISYGFVSYAGGATFARGPGFIDIGFRGDRGFKKSSAPVGFSHDGPYVGLGVHL